MASRLFRTIILTFSTRGGLVVAGSSRLRLRRRGRTLGLRAFWMTIFTFSSSLPTSISSSVLLSGALSAAESVFVAPTSEGERKMIHPSAPEKAHSHCRQFRRGAETSE